MRFKYRGPYVYDTAVQQEIYKAVMPKHLKAIGMGILSKEKIFLKWLVVFFAWVLFRKPNGRILKIRF
ncbi:hypothetical protein AYB33_05890 [Leptospira santarosai]|nr:hypothetical protein AYB33_05890 [Leptospira santarosai]